MNGAALLARWLVLGTALTLSACGSGGSQAASANPALTVVPTQVTLQPTAEQSFSATVTGAATPSVSWSVKEGATGGSISSSGLYTAPATPGTYTVVAVESGSGVRGEASVTVALPRSSPPSGGRFVALVAPVAGETFTAPASLRFVAAARDTTIDTNYPTQGHGGNASKVQFLVDDTVVLEQAGTEAEYWVFKGFAAGIGAGPHTVRARAIYTNPDLILDSAPVTITVASPTYGQVVNLSGDLVVTGTTHAWIGTPDSRVRVNGNGYRIIGSGATAISWRYVDFFDVGNRTSTDQAGIDVATSASLDVENCSFDSSNTVQFNLGGAAPATLRGNTFRSNMRQPLGQYPGGGAGGSYPVAVFRGASTGAKTFAGNNVGAGWIQFAGSAQSWLVGGDTAADCNVLIGPRVGVYADQTTSSIRIRRNYSHHIYYGGWSQGSNYELGGVASLVAEHNVIAGSSWPVRGVGGEFRYNLVLEAGHQWLWADTSSGYVHHNLFIGGDADIGGIYVPYGVSGVRIHNNTIDGMDAGSVVAGILQAAGSTSVSSNLFVGVPGTPVRITGGSLAADYNLFWSSSSPSYSDGRSPAHDVQADPLLASPASRVYDLDELALWNRTLDVHDVLARYRSMYTPTTGSPAIDAGDPALGAGNDIGCVGGGAPNPADQFGK